MLLGLAVTAAAPIAWADSNAKVDAPPTDATAGTGAERPGVAPMMGPPRAPTVTGQSPLMVTSPDARDFQRRRPHRDRDRANLKPPAQTGK
jgi:hypothetical protein